MKPELRRIGGEQSPVVVIDDFTGRAADCATLADALAPFPPVGQGYYPGVRRVLGETDGEAFAYARQLCIDAAPFIAGAFGIANFTLVEASFSIVCQTPDALQPPQRAPHFDSTDPDYLALLHYLRLPTPSATAFFRQKETAIERIDDNNVDRFVAFAQAARTTTGYIQGSDPHYEEIGRVDALVDRLLIYQGCLLHSGIIPPAMPLSSDPREGRLTANLFVRANR